MVVGNVHLTPIPASHSVAVVLGMSPPNETPNAQSTHLPSVSAPNMCEQTLIVRYPKHWGLPHS